MIPNVSAVRQAEAIGRRRRSARRSARSGRSARRDALEHLAPRNDRVRRPVGRAAHVHVLDEAQLRAVPAAVLEQRHELVVVDAAHDDGVELQRRRTRRPRAVDAGEHRRVLVEARQRCEALGLQRVEADRDAVQAGALAAPPPVAPAARRWWSARDPGSPAARPVARSSAGRSRRSSGSPPVSRTRSTPRSVKTSDERGRSPRR